MRKLTPCAALLLAAGLGHAGALRCYWIGNSLTDELKYESFVELAASRGHKIVWGRHMIPGAPIRWLWDHPDQGFRTQFGHYPEAFKSHTWDVVTLQPFQSFEQEYAHAEKFVRLLAQKSPDAQVYIYAQWPSRRGPDWAKLFAESKGEMPAWQKKGLARYDAAHHFENVVKRLEAKGWRFPEGRSLRNRYEVICLGLREMGILRKPIRLIPAGHVMQLLDEKMRLGHIPGYTSVWQLYSDGVHVSNLGSFLVGCTFYATIFGESPVGLPVVGDYAPRKHADDHVAISEGLAKLVQETVWEVVASHPLTGVTAGDALRIVTRQPLPAVAGTPYRFRLRAAFGAPPYRWAIVNGTLPEGIALDATGLLSGTPTAAGAATPTIQVVDSKGAKATRLRQLIVEADVAPRITTTGELPDWSRGVHRGVWLEAEGGNGFRTWAVKEGRLPTGVTLRSDGLLVGAPGQVGAFTFTAAVTDSDAVEPDTATHAFTLRVGPARGDILFLRKAAKAPTLDGKPDGDAWRFEREVANLVAGDEWNNQAAFDAVWDDKALYVAIRVTDDAIHEQKWSPEKGDHVEIFIDALNNRERTYNWDDRRIVVGVSGQRSRTECIGDMFPIKTTGGPVPGGYLIEAAIPWRNLGLHKRAVPHLTLGLDVAVSDDDDAKGPTSRAVWKGTADNATDPSRFGTAILAE